MIVRPFLRDQCDGPMVVHNSTNSTLERNRTILNTTTVYKVLKEPVTVQYGYWIIASIQVGVVWCGVVWWGGVGWGGVGWGGVGCGVVRELVKRLNWRKQRTDIIFYKLNW